MFLWSKIQEWSMHSRKKIIFGAINFFRLVIFSVKAVLNKALNAPTIAIENPSDGKNKKRSAKIPPLRMVKAIRGAMLI
jgi:hypothetical protein